MCSLLSQCLHSCTVPDLIQVPLHCSLGLCLTDIHKFLIGSLLRPPNLFCHNEPGGCPDVFSSLFLLIFLYHTWDIPSPVLKLELQTGRYTDLPVNLVSSIVFLSCIPAKSINNFFRFFNRDISIDAVLLFVF